MLEKTNVLEFRLLSETSFLTVVFFFNAPGSKEKFLKYAFRKWAEKVLPECSFGN